MRPSPLPPAHAGASLLLLLLAAALAPHAAEACTRVLYQGDNATVITGRTLDWSQDSGPNMWAMPRGVARNGATGPSSITWTAKYGSVVVSMYDVAVLDGLNEKGLVANGLYLVRWGEAPALRGMGMLKQGTHMQLHAALPQKTRRALRHHQRPCRPASRH
jgi:penicillin V acylase-like amidase (Ntn superfamily)